MKKQGKSYSFDAMVKFFIQYYQIPTRRDIDRLMVKLNKLEKTIVSLQRTGATGTSVRGVQRKTAAGSAMTAVDSVFSIIKRHRNGIDVPAIKKKTGLNDKAVRNVIFRLTKQNKIARKSRGVYTAVI